MATKIRRGATITGIVNLRNKQAGSGSQFDYVIPGGAVIQLKFPGATSTVILSTATPGEITIVNANTAQISFIMSATKSALLALGMASVDCIITASGAVDIFEETSVFNILDPANP